jgi:hypothetical protein
VPAGCLSGCGDQLCAALASRSKIVESSAEITALTDLASTLRCVSFGGHNPRLWLDGLVVLAAVGAGYFLAVSLGLLASACSPSPRVALLAGLALLVAWDAAPQVIPQVVRLAWPGIQTEIPLGLLIGGTPDLHINILRSHVGRFPPHYRRVRPSPGSWSRR